MARFRGTIQGDGKPEASRLGNGYLRVTARGWKGGIAVHIYIDGAGIECVEVLRDHGSNNANPHSVIYQGPLNPEDSP